MFLKAYLKPGEKLVMWLTKLEIAIVEKDTEALSKLIDKLPEFDNTDEMLKAMYLIREASILMHTLKDETSSQMKQIKKSLNFLSSAQAPRTSKLDLRS